MKRSLAGKPTDERWQWLFRIVKGSGGKIGQCLLCKTRTSVKNIYRHVKDQHTEQYEAVFSEQQPEQQSEEQLSEDAAAQERQPADGDDMEIESPTGGFNPLQQYSDAMHTPEAAGQQQQQQQNGHSPDLPARSFDSGGDTEPDAGATSASPGLQGQAFDPVEHFYNELPSDDDAEFPPDSEDEVELDEDEFWELVEREQAAAAAAAATGAAAAGLAASDDGSSDAPSSSDADEAGLSDYEDSGRQHTAEQSQYSAQLTPEDEGGYPAEMKEPAYPGDTHMQAVVTEPTHHWHTPYACCVCLWGGDGHRLAVGVAAFHTTSHFTQHITDCSHTSQHITDCSCCMHCTIWCDIVRCKKFSMFAIQCNSSVCACSFCLRC